MHSVLVIDDDESLRSVLARWVDISGYRAREADSAEEALYAMEREVADVALCDVTMAGRDGVWLASEIRRLYPQTAIIMRVMRCQLTSSGIVMDSCRCSTSLADAWAWCGSTHVNGN